jgi:hypothetical protein
LPDVTAAVVNGNYALDYGIDPNTAIFEEKDYDDDSYFCLMAVPFLRPRLSERYCGSIWSVMILFSSFIIDKSASFMAFLALLIFSVITVQFSHCYNAKSINNHLC